MACSNSILFLVTGSPKKDSLQQGAGRACLQPFCSGMSVAGSTACAASSTTTQSKSRVMSWNCALPEKGQRAAHDARLLQDRPLQLLARPRARVRALPTKKRKRSLFCWHLLIMHCRLNRHGPKKTCVPCRQQNRLWHTYMLGKPEPLVTALLPLILFVHMSYLSHDV